MNKIKIICLSFSLVVMAIANAQENKKVIYKHYFQTPLPSVYEGSRVVLYKDSTFLNFCISTDAKKKKGNICYTNGIWKIENGIPIFTFLATTDEEIFINEIKRLCKDRQDYEGINTSFVFIFQKGNEGSLFANKEELYDLQRNLNYKELNPGSLSFIEGK